MKNEVWDNLKKYHFRGTFNHSSEIDKANLNNGDTLIYCDKLFVFYNGELSFLESFIDNEPLKNKILDFINNFKSSNPEAIEECFSQGYCFWFARILEERFHGEIYYNPIDNHFICKIGDLYFDIFGEKIVHKKEYQLWSHYEHKDLMETDRIYRDCIHKLSSDCEIDYKNHICDGEYLRLKRRS